MSAVPIQIAANVSLGDSTAPRAAASPWDEAVAALAEEPAILRSAWKATRRFVNAPIDLLLNQAYAVVNTGTGALVVDEEDEVFGHDSIDVSPGAASTIDAPNNGVIMPASYSLGFIFVPTVEGTAFNVLGLGPTPYGLRVRLTATNVVMTPQLAVGETTMFSRATQINESGPNVMIVCIDAASRQMAMYLNSLTPFATATGIPPNPFPSAFNVTANVASFGGGGATNVDGGDVRMAAGFVASESLYATAPGRVRARALVQAAADAYGINLL
ncbi:MAG: hypothetical protein E5Y55_23970 [Mesorhizobium sp.]|uniref:hypothetical protein n=1 Tax=Mesorhizobium sp. TaxID=1871066 RepID=UPI0011F7B0EB|nr:hypothetical protein [Mesorhizobium sp.]TIM41739.1 MAG: hypothetical protein E5Y55_23970 [Mesorhizobium sp.]